MFSAREDGRDERTPPPQGDKSRQRSPSFKDPAKDDDPDDDDPDDDDEWDYDNYYDEWWEEGEEDEPYSGEENCTEPSDNEDDDEIENLLEEIKLRKAKRTRRSTKCGNQSTAH